VGITPTPELISEVAAIAELATLEISTAPFGTSTGGFAFTFDRQLGTLTRATRSFGPTFAERSLSAGKGKFSVGFNSLNATYNSLGGYDLTSGDLRTAKNGNNLGPFSYFSVRVNGSSNTIVGFASYGLTNDFDIAIAVPWIRITLDADEGAYTATNIDLTSGGHVLMPRTSRSGVGDIAVFGKYHFWHQKEGGLAAALELRLPTGDTDNLRGIGVTRTLVSAIWSRGGKLSPHANVGYEFWSSAVPISASGDVFAKNQVNYAFGAEFQAHPRATLSIDLIGRRQLEGGLMGYRTVPFGLGSVDALVPLPEGLNVISLAPGIKWNVAGNVLVSGNILTSLVNKGLTANVIPVIGLEWAF
jgi:hypothetical protein